MIYAKGIEFYYEGKIFYTYIVDSAQLKKMLQEADEVYKHIDIHKFEKFENIGELPEAGFAQVSYYTVVFKKMGDFYLLLEMPYLPSEKAQYEILL